MTTDDDIRSKIDFSKPYAWIATWLGVGLLKPGPGTWGTLAALPVGALIFRTYSVPGLAAAFMCALFLGFWAAANFEKDTDSHDSSIIVIDEVAGIWLALLFTTGSLQSIIIAFVLFRIFDIWKPWPVSVADSQPGAIGVMADDIIAGMIAGLLTGGFVYAGLG